MRLTGTLVKVTCARWDTITERNKWDYFKPSLLVPKCVITGLFYNKEVWTHKRVING